MNIKIIKIMTCLLMPALAIFSFGQENWGPPQYVQIVAGCSYLIANPCFYDSNRYCYESLRFDDYYCQLGYGDFYSGPDPVLIPGDSLNLPGYNYIGPYVNTEYDKLYFSSDIPGGYGGFDIWLANWDGSQWGTPQNLGPGINTAMNEFGPSLTGAEDEIYFYRNSVDWQPRDLSGINGNIYKSIYTNNSWNTAITLPPPININDCSFEPSISFDGMKLYFCSYRPDIADHRFVYMSQRSGDDWQEPELLNSNINHLVSLQPWYDDSSGDVYSFSLDNSGTSALFTHYDCFELEIEGQIRISHLTVGINEGINLPDDISFSCYPNPFNSEIVFRVLTGSRDDIDVMIYNISGQRVALLNSKKSSAGMHELIWKPINQSSGVYFAKLLTGGYISSRKVVYLK